jgi:hypothetical protein
MSTERLVALCAGAHLRSWIEGETADLVGSRAYAATVPELVALVGRGGASAGELLVLDLDMLTAPWTFELKSALEDRWWKGTMVGLGTVRGVHRRYLSIERAIGRPLGSEALRAIVERTDEDETKP